MIRVAEQLTRTIIAAYEHHNKDEPGFGKEINHGVVMGKCSGTLWQWKDVDIAKSELGAIIY